MCEKVTASYTSLKMADGSPGKQLLAPMFELISPYSCSALRSFVHGYDTHIHIYAKL